ncbi:MAG TPA: hypothetical protein VGW57_12640 [Chthoniobacterales bacterium]|nr:hypothetical protein [Chthoniobacterales bacterium]
MPALLHAQTKVADAETYRATKRAATATFLDSKRPDAERLEAAKKLGYPEAESAGFLAVGTDRAQSDSVRRIALGFVHPAKFLEAAVKILDDPDDGGEELDAGLIQDISRRTTFRIPMQDQQRIQNVERKLLADKRPKVRLFAYRALVGNHDSVAINQLADSLRQQHDVPIPLPEAIDLLHDDGSSNHLTALRPYLNHEDPGVQAVAARALALDPESRGKIVELATNPRSPDEVRVNALRGLAREDDKFPSYAIALVENTEDKPAVRLAAMQDFVGRMNYGKVNLEDQTRFARAVKKIAGEDAARSEDAGKLRETAKQLVGYLKKAFPALQNVL